MNMENKPISYWVEKKHQAICEDYPYFPAIDLTVKHKRGEDTIWFVGKKYQLKKDMEFRKKIYRPVMKELHSRYFGYSNAELVAKLDLNKEKICALADEYGIIIHPQPSPQEIELQSQLEESRTECEQNLKRYKITHNYFFQALIELKKCGYNEVAAKLRRAYGEELSQL